MEFHLAEVPLRNTRHWVFDALAELEADIDVELYGELLSSGPASLFSAWREQRTTASRLVLALPGPAPTGPGDFGGPATGADPVPLLGMGRMDLPLRDNLRLADGVEIKVAAKFRRQGIGTALWHRLARLAIQEDRQLSIGFSSHASIADDEDPGAVRPATGVGVLPADASSHFAHAIGFTLEQVERRSALPLPVLPETLARLEREASATASGYDVVSWRGATPQEYLDGVARMQTALSEDAPAGSLEWQPEVWDAHRVRVDDAALLEAAESFVTVGVHRGSGAVAAYTQIVADRQRPTFAAQYNTVVAREHRGHGLGLAVKVANLRQLGDHLPTATKVITWNAGENSYMLAINHALGFRLHSTSGAWQRPL